MGTNMASPKRRWREKSKLAHELLHACTIVILVVRTAFPYVHGRIAAHSTMGNQRHKQWSEGMTKPRSATSLSLEGNIKG